MKDSFLRLYRAAGLAMAAVFACVGLVFVLAPDGTVAFFNGLSGALGLSGAPAGERGFFVILAGAYMYAVALLAWMMFRRPSEAGWALVLGQAKAASAVLSFLFFALHRTALIYLANGVVDGAIAVFVLFLYFKMKGRTGATAGA